MTTISVDNDFARFGGKSYAINKINTVEVREDQPHSRDTTLLFGVIGIACLAWSVAAGFEIGLLVVAGICGALAWQAWHKSKIRTYSLFLMTSSSETQAFVSGDREEVYDLRDSIEAAMLHHSRNGIPV